MGSTAANYYETLNIPRDADAAAVKRAYFSLVKTRTPDKDPEGFIKLREAFETLHDVKKRSEYDAVFSAPYRLQKDLMTARELMKRTKLKEAVKTLEALSDKNPGEPEVSRLLARAYHSNGNNGKAQKLCEEILKANPDDPDAPLLLAEVFAARGYRVKAQEQYRSAALAAPDNPKTWAAYLRFLFEESPYKVPEVMETALLRSEDMFKDDYVIYIRCAQICSEYGHKADAEKYLNKFAEFFLADSRPGQAVYNAAVAVLSAFAYDDVFFPCFNDILPALMDSGHRQPHHGKVLEFISRSMVIDRLKHDERIGEELCTLTEILLSDCGCDDCKNARITMECNIVIEMAQSRKQIRTLRDYYPEFFKLHQAFYQDVLNPKKEDYLKSKYYAEYRRLFKTESRGPKGPRGPRVSMEPRGPRGTTPDKPPIQVSLPGFGDEDDDKDEGFAVDPEDGDPFAPPKPYTRETPKVGRNDPCPCDSGKKYKRCCGR